MITRVPAHDRPVNTSPKFSCHRSGCWQYRRRQDCPTGRRRAGGRMATSIFGAHPGDTAPRLEQRPSEGPAPALWLPAAAWPGAPGVGQDPAPCPSARVDRHNGGDEITGLHPVRCVVPGDAYVRRRYGPPPICFPVGHICGGLLIPLPDRHPAAVVVGRQPAPSDLLFDNGKKAACCAKGFSGGAQKRTAQGQEVLGGHLRPRWEAVNQPLRAGGERAVAHAASPSRHGSAS